MTELVHKELSEHIIGAATTVLNALKPGLDEKLYENALVIELGKRGHTVDQQRQFPVYYEGVQIGKLIPDLIVDDLVITDTKVCTRFDDSHVAQMLGYLAITELKLALLLNFKRRDSNGNESSADRPNQRLNFCNQSCVRLLIRAHPCYQWSVLNSRTRGLFSNRGNSHHENVHRRPVGR